jgi:hypothetical protein
MKIKHGLILFVTVLLVVAVLASWLLRPAEMAQLGMEPQNLLVDGEAPCDAAEGPCEFRQGRLGLIFSLPEPVRPLQPFELHLRVEGLEPSRVVATFTMSGMDMGLNRFELQPGVDGWRGRAMLPICTEARKDWLATVSLHGAEGDYRVVFPFTAQ